MAGSRSSRRRWRALLAPAGLCAALAGLPAAADPPILPFAEVRAGMRGTGRTVFAGTTIETFEVEILGTLPRVGPDQDLILARLSGGPLERTGVMAGMSGSPIFIDSRLVGAIGYTWGFSTEPIAGIVPIAELLALRRTDAGGRGGVAAVDPADWGAPLGSATALRAFLEGQRSRLFTAAAPMLPLPLSVAGLGAAAIGELAPELRAAGLLALQAGSPDPVPPAPPLEPGSAIGVKLVRGDIDMTATGTLTWIEDREIVAFGHPLFGLGSIDLPLTAARVEAVLPSLQLSARFATPTAEIGAAREDRTAGLGGVLGASARMIPVRVQLETAAGTARRYSFDIADDPLLSPLLLYFSLRGILASHERAFGSATVRLAQGSVIQLVDHEDVALDNLYAGPAALDYGTGVAAYLLYLLMNNPWSRPQIVGVNLLLQHEDQPRSARIRRAILDRYRASPGSTVEAAIALSPHRGPARLMRRSFVIPPETPPGRLEVSVGGAAEVTRQAAMDEPMQPLDLEQLIRLVNQLRRNDRIYVLVHREDEGLLIGGTRLPSLPPSAAAMLGRPLGEGQQAQLVQRGILEETIETDHAIEGGVRLELLIEEP